MENKSLSEFKPPWLIRNSHVQTILTSLFRKPQQIDFQRERFELQDGDFVDLDWKKKNNKNLVILLHGLESNTKRGYMLSMAHFFLKRSYDVCALNFRGCSGEDNRLLKSYHSGKTDDLREFINVLKNSDYQSIVLIGFSLGGNVLLKYLGEEGQSISSKITKAIAISVPCDLSTSSRRLHEISNFLYHRKFLNSLKKKVLKKESNFKQEFDFHSIKNCKTLFEFDNQYTSKVNGYKDAEEYYSMNSSVNFIKGIFCKTLIINALDDPFLTPECFPFESKNRNITLITPKFGGHVGFLESFKNEFFWHEVQVGVFINDELKKQFSF